MHAWTAYWNGQFVPDDQICITVLDRNRPRLGPRDDVLLTHRMTRGPSSPPLGGLPPGPPTVLITCRPVPFASFARLAFITGQMLVDDGGRFFH